MAKASDIVFQYLKSDVFFEDKFAELLVAYKMPITNLEAGMNVEFRPQYAQATPPHDDDFTIFRSTVQGREVTIVETSGINPDDGEFRILDMAIVIGKNTWTVRCFARPKEFDKREKDFKSILGSFRILGTDSE